MKRISYIILATLLTTGISYAQEIPVLPLPVHIEKGNPQTPVFSAPLTFRYIGLDGAATARLQEHWQQFLQTRPSANKQHQQANQHQPTSQQHLLANKQHQSPTSPIQIGLLGVNQQFDSLLAQPAAQWQQKIGKEGYLLIFNTRQRIIAANTETGLFYALQTLKQLVRANWQQELLIADYPAFERRAIYDDISRGPISTVDYIKEQIERLAELKINELSFYIEHVVQPLSYPDFAPANGKLTIPQIKELSAYAAKYHIQLVGSFQSFGHFDKILALPQYRSMGATSTLISPLDPQARDFLKNVIGELCDAFSAPYFNANCDETFDLGKGRSKAYVDSVGPARYYADHIKFLYDIVKQYHKKLMIWGDIALTHEEILDLLPRDIIYLTWEYGGQSSFAQWITPFQKRGLEFIVCPGILNSYRLIPDMTMATANIDGFLPEGKAKGASGVMTTIWDDGSAYLFSGDWYGVYKAADKSWNLTAKDKTSFDTRYSITAYGSSDKSYVRALDTMMTLRKLALTYNLTDNIWTQKLLPDSGRRLILNNKDTDTALHIIRNAQRLIAAARPQWHASDIATLKLSIDQYQLIMDGRQQIVHIALDYQKALDLAVTDPSGSVSLLNSAAVSANELKNRYARLRETFRNAWLRENQPYWLDVTMRPYDQRIKDLQQLALRLQQAARSIKPSRPESNNTQPGSGVAYNPALQPPSSLRLDITGNDHYYFQNWLLCGPFPTDSNNNLPTFLYAGDAAADTPPKPGDLFSFNNKTYRWKKYASPDGGITELDNFYPTGTNAPGKSPAGNNQAAYAFCTITTEAADTIASFVSGNNNMQVFCNGVQISATRSADPAKAKVSGKSSAGQEQKLLLPLRAGTNNILFKIPADKTAWSFSFRLDPHVAVTNQKYKYFLNTEKGAHEAE